MTEQHEEGPNETERPPSAEGLPIEPSTTEPGTTPAPFFGDSETTVNLTGDALADIPARDDAEEANDTAAERTELTRAHLKGLLEALVFASDKPIKPNELAKAASAQTKEVKELLGELKAEYAARGIQLDEVAGGWIFRTNAQFAPFVRDLTKQKPVRLSRAQVETLAILAYRQPITRPEIDDIRGVDCGPVLKLLLERDLIKILGKKDEPGRPILYGTTNQFLEFFGLRSLKDLPTLKEFTELNEDSRRVVERELGEVLEQQQPAFAEPTASDAAPRESASESMSEPPLEHEEASDVSQTDPPSEGAEPDTDSRLEAADAVEELPHDTIPPPAARKPGPWELAADGEEEEEEDDEEDEDDEDEDDDDEEDDEDEADE